MPRSRPSSDPISFHKPTGQFYVTRGGSRVYLGADRDAAIERYYRLALGLAEVPKLTFPPVLYQFLGYTEYACLPSGGDFPRWTGILKQTTAFSSTLRRVEISIPAP